MQKILDKIKNEPTVYMFRKVWSIAGERRPWLVAEYILQAIAQLIYLTEPLIFAAFVNELQQNGLKNINYLIGLLSLFTLLILAVWIFHGTSRAIGRRNAFIFEVKYANYLLNGLFNLNLQWHADRDSGDLIDKIKKSTQGIFAFTTSAFNFVRVFIRLFGVSIILLMFNVYIGVTAFIITIFALFVLFRFDKYIVVHIKQMIKDNNKISAGIFDAMSNISSVFILHIQRPVLNNIDKLLWRPWDTFKKNVRLMEFKWFTGELIFNLLVVLPIAGYLLYLYKNNIAVQIGTVTALYMYLSRMSQVFYTLGNIYEATMIRKANVQNAEEIEQVIEANKSRQAARQIITDWEELDIIDLNFSYNATQSKLGSSTSKSVGMHLDNVSLKISKGERIAFIGESGSGKTTFLKVLHGLYDSASARLRLQSRQGTPSDMQTNFTDIDFATMLVPQEPEVFSSTIKENITLGLPTKAEEINKVLRLARFDDVVEKLPKGLKSVINEKGVNLSGGQKQRLALARALLFAKDKQVLLLDESTSSVDPENEAKIYEGIFSEYKGKTILASIHKMNLLKYFDRVVIFKDGKVVDQGTFDELLESNRSFKKDWEEFVKSRS